MNNDQAEPRSIADGMIVAQYRVVHKIGAGGMGEVWLAYDEKLERNVALKFPSPKIFDRIELRESLLREARAAAALHHPNVVTVYEVGLFEERPFLAMAFVEGSTLKEFAEGRNIPVEQIIRLGIQISDALANAHERGITHRDLKPGNVMVDKSQNVQILDFGLAVTQRPECDDDLDQTVTRLTSRSSAAGTLRYMSPEQLTGGKIGPRVDLFALGIILYELIYEVHPFQGASVSELVRNVIRGASPPFPEREENVPYDLTRIIRRCLKEDPDQRFQTARDVHNELVDLQELRSNTDEPSAADLVGSPKWSPLQEKRFELTTNSIRELSFQSARMIGDHIAYVDNGVVSDTLVIYLHAWGLDHRHAEEFLASLPCRGVAPTLYGFGLHANHRFPLSLEDHSRLLRSLFRQLHVRIQPKRVILTGFSSGADHAVHLATSPIDAGIRIDGLLPFGCNTSYKSCFLSARFAELKHSNTDELLDEMKRIGSNTRSIGEWLKFHEYMVTVFTKFGKNADPLKVFGADLAKGFLEHDWEQFAIWYRTAAKKVPHLRFVVDADDLETVDTILENHLQRNVLGDQFMENTIVREDAPHVQLAHPEILLKHTLVMIQEMNARS
jgi:serine/threonine protein kinase